MIDIIYVIHYSEQQIKYNNQSINIKITIANTVSQ